MTIVYTRTSLAREIDSIEQVMQMTDQQLRVYSARHQAETLGLRQRIEKSTDPGFQKRGRSALKVLNLHKSWIDDELKRRARHEQRNHEQKLKETAKEITEANIAAVRDRQEARMDRVQAANSKTLREIGHFKRLVRAHVGDSVYEAFWMEAERLVDAERAEGKSAE